MMALWRKNNSHKKYLKIKENDDDKKRQKLIEKLNWTNPINSFYISPNGCSRTEMKTAQKG